MNSRAKWRGHLWQGRFASFVMDEPYLLAAARHIERNPVRARLTKLAGAYAWSSAKAHLSGSDDILVKAAPLLKLVPDWRAFIDEVEPKEDRLTIRRHELTGRPLVDAGFLKGLEARLGRVLRRLKPGPKPKRRAGNK